MKTYTINIGRQLGSGGRLIGEKLAERLGVPCYDKELIFIASKESGLCKEFFERADEMTQFVPKNDLSSWFSSIFGGEFAGDNFLCNDSLFRIQSDVIRRLADEGSCIFVGRCADYILRDRPNCLNVFISADFDDRIKRVTELFKINETKARELIIRTDKRRAGYYNYYSNKLWGHATSYHICINSSKLGIEKTINLIQSNL
ncbi:MAG: cytidylate kinase-like family protein [Prevotellaceae bacterium]|jgi:cytidylate kinase|nr:cytidylate kinase-like family protein [Prevotellaceae bacterium]